MNRADIIKEHCKTYNEDDRLLSRHGQIEFLTTVRYVEKYLNPGMKLIEISAIPGRYSHYFVRNGYAVDAVELSEDNILTFCADTLPDENISVTQGDIEDINALMEPFPVTRLHLVGTEMFSGMIRQMLNEMSD